MNLNLIKINILVLIFVVESHGGLIDGVYGRIKNTTTGLTQDVKNVWSYSKSLVGQGDTTEEHKDGLIGSMIHSTNDRMHSLHEQLWKVEDIPNDSGLLWNMYNRLKQRLVKAKHFILGDGEQPIEGSTEKPNEEFKVIKETMDQLFNTDGTRKIDGDLFDEVVENLKKKLNEMRHPESTGATNTLENNGEGLIDVRLGDVSKDIEDNAGDAAGVSNDIYDKVNSLIDNNVETIHAIPDPVKNNINEGIETAKDSLNNVKDGAVAFKNKAQDTAAKEKDLLDTGYSKLDLTPRIG